jgi:predicted NAD-dependent protein-ADP-ribosyltransferase YbiA (DUF1768 family)
LLDAYLAIPEHLRRYSLGDMDSKDWPLQVLAAGVGGRMPVAQTVVTEKMHGSALEYFVRRDQAGSDHDARSVAFGPVQPETSAVSLAHRFFPKGWPDDPGLLGGIEYPNVDRAYFALSTDDESLQRAVLEAETDYAAKRIAEAAPRRSGWAQARPAVMARLMRAKYAHHPELAQLLLSTDDAKILYSSADSLYWGEAGKRGRNWVGRLLELIRSELGADAAGIGAAWLD